MLDMPFFGADSLNDYISKNGGYYTASLVPIDDEYEKPMNPKMCMRVYYLYRCNDECYPPVKFWGVVNEG